MFSSVPFLYYKSYLVVSLNKIIRILRVTSCIYRAQDGPVRVTPARNTSCEMCEHVHLEETVP